MGLIGTHHPSSIGLFCPQLINWFVDPQPVLPNSNLRARTVRVLALALPPASVGYPLNLQQAPRPLSPCAGPARQRRQPAPFQSWLSQSASVFVWLRWAGHVTVVRPLLASSSKATHTPDNLSVGNDEHRDVTPTATPSSFLAFLGTPDQSSLTRPSAITQPPQRADYVTAVGRVCLAGWASPVQRIRALSDELHVLRFVSGLQQLGCSA